MDGKYTYFISARGALVAQGSGTASPTPVNVPVTQAFSPQATVVVYALIKGEMYADTLTINVDGLFENQVNISLSFCCSCIIEVFIFSFYNHISNII